MQSQRAQSGNADPLVIFLLEMGFSSPGVILYGQSKCDLYIFAAGLGGREALSSKNPATSL